MMVAAVVVVGFCISISFIYLGDRIMLNRIGTEFSASLRRARASSLREKRRRDSHTIQQIVNIACASTASSVNLAFTHHISGNSTPRPRSVLHAAANDKLCSVSNVVRPRRRATWRAFDHEQVMMHLNAPEIPNLPLSMMAEEKNKQRTFRVFRCKKLGSLRQRTDGSRTTDDTNLVFLSFRHKHVIPDEICKAYRESCTIAL